MVKTSQKKETMSVREMREILGIKKTDSYWLIKRNYFKTVIVDGKIRVDIRSFEDWYANQVHHRKVNGEEPGQKLMESSYSVRDISVILGITESSVLDLIHKESFPVIEIQHHWRIDKDLFHQWYQNQDHYRTPEDRERDHSLEAASMTLPEMGIMLCVDRNGAYRIVKENPQLEVIIVAGKKRVMIQSFEDWYASQEKYHKFVDLGSEERERFLQQHVDDAVGRKIRQKYIRNPDKARLKEKQWFSPEEVADIMAISRNAVLRLIQKGSLSAKRFGKQYRVSKDDILWLMTREESKRTGGFDNGINLQEKRCL